MIRSCSVAAALCALAGLSSAQPSIEYLPKGYIVTDLSYDGTVAVGNVSGDYSYETFRWTAATGAVRLGRATVPVLGTGAGTPDVSYDGTRISATILTSDETMATQGIWDEATGWQETMPPSPPDGMLLDNGLGSAWGLSGDGSTLTGFYWKTGGDAQACAWTEAGGMVALPQDAGRSARVNGANYDGSVVVGWEERPDGAWQPRAWLNGVKIVLDPGEAFCEANAVSADGSVIVGYTWDGVRMIRLSTIWRWNGSSYDTEQIGYLPGTVLNSGFSFFDGVSDDGRLAVGTNFYNFTGAWTDGIVWTPQTGLVKDTAFLSSLGLSVMPGQDITGFSAVSGDGTTIAGVVYIGATGEYRSFLVHLPCVSDFDGNGFVNGDDFDAFVILFEAGDLGADIDGNTFVNGDDFDYFVQHFEAGC